MSNVVQFLETLARNPKRVSAEDYVALVVAAGLNPATEHALLANDASALKRDLNARAVACLIFPAEDEPNDGQEQEGEEEAPDQESSALAA